jgi:hypothetical protein
VAIGLPAAGRLWRPSALVSLSGEIALEEGGRMTSMIGMLLLISLRTLDISLTTLDPLADVPRSEKPPGLHRAAFRR